MKFTIMRYEISQFESQRYKVRLVAYYKDIIFKGAAVFKTDKALGTKERIIDAVGIEPCRAAYQEEVTNLLKDL